MNSFTLRTALLLPAIAVAGAIGFALPASVAVAQASHSEKTASGAEAKKPGSVGGVTVQGRRRSQLHRIPPDKAAAFDDEAAKSEAWKKYRKSTPPAAAGTLGQAEGYPGAQSLVRH
jgi:hypothetical protein